MNLNWQKIVGILYMGAALLWIAVSGLDLFGVAISFVSYFGLSIILLSKQEMGKIFKIWIWIFSLAHIPLLIKLVPVNTNAGIFLIFDAIIMLAIIINIFVVIFFAIVFLLTSVYNGIKSFRLK